MHALFADGIDIGLVVIGGIFVLVPLMAFEVFVEAFVLKKTWHLPFRELCVLTLIANGWSLVAGIPTKILNSYIYSFLLPQDIPGFFARYPLAITLGSLIYFAVTVLVEAAYAFRWVRRKQVAISAKRIWSGMLLANFVTYAVLSPIYYFATKPINEVRSFTNDTRWTKHAAATIVFISEPDGLLKSIQADGSDLKTIVPFPMGDYLVSSNLNICLFRGTNGNLYLYRHDSGTSNLIWQTTERYLVNRTAFSPSGERVAFASEKQKTLEIVNTSSGKRKSLPLPSTLDYESLSIVWSTNELNFFVGDMAVTLDAKDDATLTPLKDTNALPVWTCYGRTGKQGSWWSGNDWGAVFDSARCGDLQAWCEPGLGSCLRIFRPEAKSNRDLLTIAVNPGLLHLGRFGFGDADFLDDCNECVFDANGYIYVLDVKEKRLSTLTEGNRFIRLTSRFAK